MKSIHDKYLDIIKEMSIKFKDIKVISVKAFKYENDTVTPNRICIFDEDELPSCVDVFTNNFGSRNCAKRYIPEKECGDWIFNDEGDYFCSKCYHYPAAAHTEYCPHCGSPMNN